MCDKGNHPKSDEASTKWEKVPAVPQNRGRIYRNKENFKKDPEDPVSNWETEMDISQKK